MTEEKRVIVSEYGTLSCIYPPVGNRDRYQPIWHFTDSFNDPALMTKSEFKDIVNNDMAKFLRDIINFIGVDEFWNKYSKPVPEQRWYVKVPRLNDVYYCICRPEYGEKTLRTCDLYIVDTYPIDVYEVSFTEAEIKKYHLEDCKKELVDDK